MDQEFLEGIAQSLTPIDVAPANLLLDPENPRFVGDQRIKLADKAEAKDPRVQETLRLAMVEHFGGAELVESIERVGFLKMDRLVVRPLAEGSKKYVVIEGNRRLSAIKTLLAKEERRQVVLQDHVRASLVKVEALLLDCDGDLYQDATWFLQGLRHISGVVNWGPYQQAELVSRLTEQRGVDFTTAGDSIGVGRRKAGQMLRAYKGLKQMEENAEFGAKARPELFSHFEQAWVKQPLREWLSWDEGASRFTDEDHLQWFYTWITDGIPDAQQKPFGAQEVRDKLSKVISSEDARKRLLAGDCNLDTCYGVALQSEGEFSAWQISVDETLKQLDKISWKYVLTDEDVALLTRLGDELKSLLARQEAPAAASE